MVTITLTCAHCGGTDLTRNGHAPNGKQKLRCEGCGRSSRRGPTGRAYAQGFRERALAAYAQGFRERCSMRGVCRISALLCFGISRQTLITWLKKSRGAAAA
jgi:transposase-like protein